MTKFVFATWGDGMSDARMNLLHQRGCQIPVLNVLATRTYLCEIEKCIEYGSRLPGQVNFWIDSGAFSAWTKGRIYNAKEYAEFIESLRPRLKVFRKVFVISLDKIPGKYGRLVKQEDINEAVQQTLENTYFLIKSGLNVVPIHHQGEPLSVMREYLRMAEYVGISPANDSGQNKRLEYVKSLYPLFRADTGIIKAAHNFGNTSPAQLKHFPFYSADSQSWKSCMAFGAAYDINISKAGCDKASGREKKKMASVRAKTDPISLIMENIQKCLKFEREVNNLWKHRGISWAEPRGLDL